MFVMKGWCSSCEQIVETSIAPKMIGDKLVEGGKCPLCGDKTASPESKCVEFHAELKKLRGEQQA